MKTLYKSFDYAFKGILAGLYSERNLKVLFLIGILVLGAGFYFHISSTDWCIVIMCIGLVLGFELMNTAIEKLVDLVTHEWVPLAGKIKDVAAGAVLIVSFTAFVIGIIIFGKYF